MCVCVCVCVCVQLKTPHDGQRNCPKHVKFYSKNKDKFEKLVHLVGFIIKNYSYLSYVLFCLYFVASLRLWQNIGTLVPLGPFTRRLHVLGN